MSRSYFASQVPDGVSQARVFPGSVFLDIHGAISSFCQCAPRLRIFQLKIRNSFRKMLVSFKVCSPGLIVFGGSVHPVAETTWNVTVKVLSISKFYVLCVIVQNWVV